MIVSRSLGTLLGLGSLHFRLDGWLEGSPQRGSWLASSAAALVDAARKGGQTGLGIVGLDPLSAPLAIQCVRARLRLVVLVPLGDDTGPGGLSGSDLEHLAWLQALGGQVVVVGASTSELSAAAPAIFSGAGCRLVSPTDPLRYAGLDALVAQIDAEGRRADVLCLASLLGQEAAWLAAGDRRGPQTLPLDGLAVAEPGQPMAIVGTIVGTTVCTPGPNDEEPGGAGSVLAVQVTPRECDAARRLLAREEGIVASRPGAAGLAGLLRALRDDRGRRLRERRFRRAPSAAVMVTADPLCAGGAAPRTADEIPRAPVPLDALAADPARLLVRPPGS